MDLIQNDQMLNDLMTQNGDEQPSDTQAPTTVDGEIASMVTGRRRQSWDFFSDKRNIWDQCWEHMMQVYDSTGKEAWQSKVFWPETPKVCETILANMHGALLSPKAPLEWQCKVKEYEDLVRYTNDLMLNDINQGKLRYNLTPILREMMVLGTGVGKVEYDYKKEVTMVKKRQKQSMMQSMMAQMTGQRIDPYAYDFQPEEYVLKDWATVKYVDRYKIFPEPYSTEISKDHWIIEESQITNAELIEMANHEDEYYRYENVTEEVLNSGSPYNPGTDPDLQVKNAATNKNNVTLNYYDPDRPHLKQEYYGPAPRWMIDPNLLGDENAKYETVNAWFIVIDEKFVVCKKPNPNRDAAPPYVKFCYIQIPGDWDGVGPAELMRHLQVEKNELVNTALDNVNIMLNKITAILKDKVPKNNWDRLVSKPGAIWLFENIDDVRRAIMPIEFNNLLKDIYMAIQMVDAAIQEVTGAVKATLGVGGADEEAGGGTFRGQLMNKQVATERFMLYARTIESGTLMDMWRKLYQRVYQYKSYESIEGILGRVRFNEFELIPPEKLDQIADLVPLGSMTMETKSVKVAQMGEFGKAYQGRPWFKEYDLARRQWVEMGFTDPDTVIFSKEEMDKYTQFKKQLLTQGMPGGPGMSGVGQPQGGMAGPPPMEGPGVEQMPSVNPAMAAQQGPQGPGVNPMDFQGMQR